MKIKQLFLILLCSLALNANATRYYVKPNATGNGSGTSWVNAFTSIPAAISVVIPADEIWIASGTYKPGTLRTNAFAIPSGIKIYGSFSGTETALSQRDIAANPTILNGDIGTIGTHTDNCNGIISIIGIGIIMDGFTIVNGYASGGNGRTQGGAVYCAIGNSATFTNCTISNNFAQDSGGAVYLRGNLTFNKCSFVGNKTALSGGAFFADSYSTLKITNCTFTANSSQVQGGAGFGYYGVTLTIDKCKFSANSAFSSAGAVCSYYTSILSMSNSLVAGNQSNGSAINHFSPNGKIVNCTITDNQIGSSAVELDTTSQILNSIIWNNTTTVPQVNNIGIKKNCIIQNAVTNPALGIFTTNPLFINPSDFTNAPFTEDGYDYHFLASSPAANNGDNTALSAVYNQDLDGLARIQATTIDMGCYESSFVATENSVNSQNTGITYYNQTISIDENANLIGKTANIYNIAGKLVQTITNIQSQTTLENLSIGVYIIKIEEKAMKFMYQ
jgi:hypothetical protein